MCVVTLSYKKNDALAQQALATLLSTGLFTELNRTDDEEVLSIDETDPWLFEDHGDLPSLPDGKGYFTPEEALDLVLKDIRDIYEVRDAV